MSEYVSRKRLAEIGYTDRIDELDQDTAEAFILISNEFDKLERDELKKKRRK